MVARIASILIIRRGRDLASVQVGSGLELECAVFGQAWETLGSAHRYHMTKAAHHLIRVNIQQSLFGAN